MSKMRVTLTERSGDIRGTIELPPEPEFVLEGLLLVLEQFAIVCKVPPEQIAYDLYLMASGRVKFTHKGEKHGE